jgi:hypothetical protein
VALPPEAWQGAEICRHSAENDYVDLPGPVNNGPDKDFENWHLEVNELEAFATSRWPKGPRVSVEGELKWGLHG